MSRTLYIIGGLLAVLGIGWCGVQFFRAPAPLPVLESPTANEPVADTNSKLNSTIPDNTPLGKVIAELRDSNRQIAEVYSKLRVKGLIEVYYSDESRSFRPRTFEYLAWDSQAFWQGEAIDDSRLSSRYFRRGNDFIAFERYQGQWIASTGTWTGPHQRPGNRMSNRACGIVSTYTSFSLPVLGNSLIDGLVDPICETTLTKQTDEEVVIRIKNRPNTYTFDWLITFQKKGIWVPVLFQKLPNGNYVKLEYGDSAKGVPLLKRSIWATGETEVDNEGRPADKSVGIHNFLRVDSIEHLTSPPDPKVFEPTTYGLPKVVPPNTSPPLIWPYFIVAAIVCFALGYLLQVIQSKRPSTAAAE